MTALAGIRDRVEQILADTTNAIWDATWVDEGIRQALTEYSLAIPEYKNAIVSVTTGLTGNNNREFTLSAVSISDPLSVLAVWTPYTDADPEDPPNTRRFQYWRDEGVLWFLDYDLESGDSARIFYTIARTIQDLDSATATTVHPEHETMLVNGAAGHVAASRALDLTEQVTIDKLSAQQTRAWGLSKLQEFRSSLRAASRRAAADTPPWVSAPPLDRWDRGQYGVSWWDRKVS